MKKILEIGGGNNPYFIRYRMPWQGGEYICLDLLEENLNKSRRALYEHSLAGNSAPDTHSFIVGDATALPIEDRSVDEVVLSNVLSAPIHNGWNKEGTILTIKNPSGTYTRPIAGTKADGDLFYRERKPLIREALRVLKPGGTISIYTDLIIYGIDAYGRILNDLVNDTRLETSVDLAEQDRIDAVNQDKLTSGDFCFCFDAEVLPRSEVLRFTKK